jgi:AcrR family transcriptional regulator
MWRSVSGRIPVNQPQSSLHRTTTESRRRNQLGQSMGAKGHRTRAKVLETTEVLLKTIPLRELTMAQIVRRARISTATFYVYFDDVPAAVLTLLGELTQSPPGLLSLFREPWDGKVALERAHHFVASYVDRCQQHAAAFRVRNLSSDEGDPRFTDLRLNAVGPLLSVMAERIGERQKAGELPAYLHPVSTAGALVAMIERAAVVQLSPNTGVTRGRLLDVAAFLTAVLFGHGFLDRHRATTLALEAEAFSAEDYRIPLPRERAAGPRFNMDGQAIGARGARTRGRLVEATRDLLQTEALVDISVAKIARAAETAPSTFYLYFQDVPEAVLAAVSEVSQTTPELLALWTGGWDERAAEARALQFVTEYFAQWRQHHALFRVRNLAGDEGDQRFIQARADSVSPLFCIMTQRIAGFQAEGRLPAGLRPAAAASACLSMIDRLAVTPNLRAKTGNTKEALSRASAYFLSFMMGCLPQGAF